MFQMLGVFAEFERAMIAERVRAGLARAKGEGKRLGGRLVAHGTGAGACERAMTRDGTVGRSDATERSLPVHRDIDPARMMRSLEPWCRADQSRVSAPLYPRYIGPALSPTQLTP